MNVSRTINIAASAEEIKNHVTNFKTWPKWSPWLIAEPNTKVDVAADGQSYSWSGKRVGDGEMSIKQVGDKKVDYDLLFLKPWKSKADVSFLMNEKGDSTDVTWTMNSKLPFFMFFMKKKMEAFVGNDYERGLAMLKDYVETGEVPSKLEFLGTDSYAGTKYVGLKRDTTMEGMKQHMQGDFEQVMATVGEGNNGQWFSIYHNFDFVNDKISYTAAVGVDEYPANLPNNMVKGDVPAGKANTVRHVGPYEHLGNAWATSMMMMRNKEFKPVKGIHPMEFYRNSPLDTAPKDLISDVVFMVK